VEKPGDQLSAMTALDLGSERREPIRCARKHGSGRLGSAAARLHGDKRFGPGNRRGPLRVHLNAPQARLQAERSSVQAHPQRPVRVNGNDSRIGFDAETSVSPGLS
jgi:hypothetical protein